MSINKKLNDIKAEDNIWVIYILIIIASWYANNLERQYLINNDFYCKQRYRQIIIIIFSILVIVYIYFFQNAYSDVCLLKLSDTLKKQKLTELSAMGSLLIVISGLIFLYIAYMDTNIDVELAFN